jgi:hypothetical protein
MGKLIFDLYSLVEAHLVAVLNVVARPEAHAQVTTAVDRRTFHAKDIMEDPTDPRREAPADRYVFFWRMMQYPKSLTVRI